MKKYYFLIIVALILGLVIGGCSLLSNIGQVPTNEQSGVYYLTKGSPTDLVALWHFDEGVGTNASDSSGNGNNGTLKPTGSEPTWVIGKFGNALSFDGTDDYVQFPASNTILNTDNFTIEAWFKTSVNHPAYGGTEGRIVNLARDAAGFSAVALYVEENNIALCYRTTTEFKHLKHAVDYHDDVWHHIVVTRDATTYRLYYDGSLVASQTDTFYGFGIHPAYLGTYNGSERFFNGLIDEVRIWDKALQLEDILNPDISVEKSGPESAHADDIITYTYTVTNTGYVPLSDVTVSDDLTVDAAYVSGDTNGGGLLDLEETWIFIADYTVPEGVDSVMNTATASGTSPLNNVIVTADADWLVDILHPAISVVKSADTEVAAPDDTVIYSYTVTNVGDCALYDVSLVDDVVGPIALLGLTDEDEDTFADDLAQDASATGSADYLVTIDDLEWPVNTAIASGSDELVKEVTATDTWTIHTMGARTIGYWKTHPNTWCDFPSGSMFANKEQEPVLLTYFPGNGAQVDGVNPLEMLRAQLIASELNYACFEDDFHYARYEAADIFGTMRDAEALLQRIYGAANGEDLNAYWSVLSKKQQKNVKQIANPLKDTLEEFNAMGDEIFE